MNRKQLAEAAQAAAKTVKFAKSVGALQLQTPVFPSHITSFIADWQKTSKTISDALSQLIATWQTIDWKPVFSVFDGIVEQGRKAALVEQSGWLPHLTTPFHILEGQEEISEHVGALVAEHYRENWNEVEVVFRDQVARYEIDDEAKETFYEALSAHRAGRYRTAPRLLFPEIERVASDEFFDGKRKAPVIDHRGKSRDLPITRLTEVRKTAGKLPAGDILGYEYGWQLFEKLERHLYEEVGDDPETRIRFAADPVPNRHASLHGIIIYNTMQTSLNAIIMADFLFHIMSRIKVRIEQSALEDDEC